MSGPPSTSSRMGCEALRRSALLLHPVAVTQNQKALGIVAYVSYESNRSMTRYRTMSRRVPNQASTIARIVIQLDGERGVSSK